MRRFCVMALVFLASAFSFATVTVSGNLVNPATASVSSRAFVRFWIRGCGGNQARVSGTGVILPSYTDLTPTAGAISGTLYDSLTEISCGGSVGATWYGVQAYYDGKPGPEVPYNVTGASFNLNSATPNTTSPVVSAPTGDSTYQRLDGGNSATGNYIPAVNGTQALGSSGLRWDLFANDITTNATLTSTVSTGTAPFTVSSTTVSTNLNADKVDGGDWAAPNAIGTGTPAAGTFTTVTGNTSVISPALTTSTANPASAGAVRLAKSDTLKFRNNANGGDVTALSLSAGDLVQLGAGPFAVPSAADTAVGKATTDTLSNKTVTGAGSGNSITLLNAQGPVAAITGTAADADMYTYTIPANTVQANKCFNIDVGWAHSSGTAAVTYKLKFGLTVISTIGAIADTSTGSIVTYKFCNIAQNSQYYEALIQLGAATNTIAPQFGTSSKDFSGGLTVAFDFLVAATDQVTPKFWKITLDQ